MTDTYAEAHSVLTALAEGGFPAPVIDLRFHDLAADQIADLVATFPDVEWQARSGGGFEWVEAGLGCRVVAFLPTSTPHPPTARAEAIIERGKAMADVHDGLNQAHVGGGR